MKFSNNIEITFTESGQKIIEDLVYKYAEDIADAVKEEAKSVVPVDTGALKKSIEVFDGETKLEKYIGSKTIDYAIYVELGTVKMSPRAFMRNSLDKIVRDL